LKTNYFNYFNKGNTCDYAIFSYHNLSSCICENRYNIITRYLLEMLPNLHIIHLFNISISFDLLCCFSNHCSLLKNLTLIRNHEYLMKLNDSAMESSDDQKEIKKYVKCAL